MSWKLSLYLTKKNNFYRYLPFGASLTHSHWEQQEDNTVYA